MEYFREAAVYFCIVAAAIVVIGVAVAVEDKIFLFWFVVFADKSNVRKNQRERRQHVSKVRERDRCCGVKTVFININESIERTVIRNSSIKPGLANKNRFQWNFFRRK